MAEYVDREELLNIKTDLEVAVNNLFYYLESLPNDNPSCAQPVNLDKLRRLARNVSQQANLIVKLRKVL